MMEVAAKIVRKSNDAGGGWERAEALREKLLITNELQLKDLVRDSSNMSH